MTSRMMERLDLGFLGNAENRPSERPGCPNAPMQTAFARVFLRREGSDTGKRPFPKGDLSD